MHLDIYGASAPLGSEVFRCRHWFSAVPVDGVIP